MDLGVVALEGRLLCVRGLFGGRLGPCVRTDPSDTELIILSFSSKPKLPWPSHIQFGSRRDDDMRERYYPLLLVLVPSGIPGLS